MFEHSLFVSFSDCKVPQHYKENKALGKWVAKQREQYKLLKKGDHSFLTPYRLEKLEQAGFVWQVRTSLEGDEGGGILPAAMAAAVPKEELKDDSPTKGDGKKEQSATV